MSCINSAMWAKQCHKPPVWVITVLPALHKCNVHTHIYIYYNYNYSYNYNTIIIIIIYYMWTSLFWYYIYSCFTHITCFQRNTFRTLFHHRLGICHARRHRDLPAVRPSPGEEHSHILVVQWGWFSWVKHGKTITIARTKNPHNLWWNYLYNCGHLPV